MSIQDDLVKLTKESLKNHDVNPELASTQVARLGARDVAAGIEQSLGVGASPRR